MCKRCGRVPILWYSMVWYGACTVWYTSAHTMYVYKVCVVHIHKEKKAREQDKDVRMYISYRDRSMSI